MKDKKLQKNVGFSAWQLLSLEKESTGNAWNCSPKIVSYLLVKYKKVAKMGSIIQKIADEIALHGSYEAYCEFRDKVNTTIFISQEESKRNGEAKKVDYIYSHDVEKLETSSDIPAMGDR